MRYTIALSPSAYWDSAQYISASRTLYGDHNPSYLLSVDGTSSPHITLVQFECDSFRKAEKIWDMFCKELNEKKFEPFCPSFTGLGLVNGTGDYEDTTWIELSVARGEDSSPLMQLHHTAVKVLQTCHLRPLNASGAHYRPHLTLARIPTPSQIEVVPSSLYESTGFFNVGFGTSDENWQYAHRRSYNAENAYV